jgi:predicted ATP-grasp superfamily ATP-dependent carboligase
VTAPPWVLVTDDRRGQARAALAAVRALAAAGYRPAVTTSSPFSLAAASRHCARAIPVPASVVGTSAFRAALAPELEAMPYIAVLATGDAALLALGAPVEHLIDKTSLAELARAVGLQPPPHEHFPSLEELRSASSRLDYPVVIKPVVTRSLARRTVSVTKANSEEEVEAIEDDSGAFIVQPYLSEPLSSISGVIWKGRLKAAVHQRYLRTWPRQCGGACAAMSVAPDLDVEERVVELLQGFDGVFQAQFVGPYLLDVNPRVYGSLSLAVAAGANLVEVYCDLLRGIERRAIIRGRSGISYRWLEGDLRWMLAARRDGDLSLGGVLRMARPRRRTVHAVESIADPRPMVIRLRHAAARDSVTSRARSSPSPGMGASAPRS